MKKITLIGLAGALLASSTVFADNSVKMHSETDVKKSADGDYSAKVSTDSTDSAGTRVTSERVDKRDTTLTGATKVTTTSKTTSDPKGLMNKTSDSSKLTLKTNKDGSYHKKATTDSVDAADTRHKSKIDTEMSVGADGTKKTTTERRVVDDPKGLGNKNVVDTTSTLEERPDGSTALSEKKKVNETVVEDVKH